MATYYVDYAGSAGTGDGSSFANRASKIEEIWATYTVLGQTDEVRIKGNPITSLGTAAIADTSRCHTKSPGYLNEINTNSTVVYSTTTGETKINFGSAGDYGFVTGDQIMITQDSTTQDGQPSMLGVWSITVDGTDYTSSMAVKLDGYTATSNATSSTSAVLRYLIFNQAIKLNTTGLFKNIACMDAGRSAWTAESNVATSIESFNNASYSSNQVEKTRWPTGSDKISIGSSAAVGKAAYYQLPSTLDLSGYQQVSFMVFHDNSNYQHRSETPDSIRLCTDTAGNTSVHTIPIDFKGSTSSHWTAVTLDLGTNLNASIKSIAIYREQTQSSVNLYIQNVVACKASSAANSITHSSCIGLKEANNPIWSHVDMLWENNGTYWVVPVQSNNFRTNWHSRYSSPTGYWSNSGSAINIYKVEPIKLDLRGDYTSIWDNIRIVGNPGSVSDANLTISDLNTVSGGWNDTDMSSKSSDYATIIEADYVADCYYLRSGSKYLNFEDIAFHKFDTFGGDSSAGNLCRFHNIGFFHCYFDFRNRDSFGFDLTYQLGMDSSNGRVYLSQHANSVKSDFNIHALSFCDQYDGQTYISNAGSTYGSSTDRWGTIRFVGVAGGNPRVYFYVSSSNTYGTYDVDNLIIHGGTPNHYIDVSTGSVNIWEIGTLTLKNGHYFRFGYTPVHIGTADITRPVNLSNSQVSPEIFGDNFSPISIYAYEKMTIGGGTISGAIYNYSNTEFVEITGATYVGFNYLASPNSYIKWRDYNGTSGDHRTWLNSDVLAIADTSTRHTASGFSLKIDYLSASSSSTPYKYALGKIAVNANSQVTISIWVNMNTTGQTAILRVPKTDWMGVTSDQETSLTPGNYTANTWTQISKSFTPTSAGVLPIELHFLDGNNANAEVYFDDFEVSQV